MNAAGWHRVIQSEAACFGWCQTSLDLPEAHYLFDARVSKYFDANRAFRPRATGSGPQRAAEEICRRLVSAGSQVVVDVDPTGEEEGMGAALRSLGVMPVVGRMVLMGRKETPVAATADAAHCDVQVLRSGEAGMSEWREVAALGSGDPIQAPWAEFVAGQEADLPLAVHYMARWNGSPAGACLRLDLSGWGRIESVAVLPDLRRHGIATTMVRRACADSALAGNAVTWLIAESASPAEQLYRSLGFAVWAINPMRRHVGRR